MSALDDAAIGAISTYRRRGWQLVIGGAASVGLFALLVGVVLPSKPTSRVAAYAVASLLVGGLGAVLVGSWMIARATRQKACLSRSDWHTATVVRAHLYGADGSRRVPHGVARQLVQLRWEGAPRDEVVSLANTVIPLQARTGIHLVDTLQLAGEASSRYVVLRALGGGPLFSALRPRSDRARTRWLDALTRPRG